MLFQPNKSDRSSAEQNTIYIFHYPLPVSHLTPSFPLALPSRSDLIFQLLSLLSPPVLVLVPRFFLPCFNNHLSSSRLCLHIHHTSNSFLLKQLYQRFTPVVWEDDTKLKKNDNHCNNLAAHLSTAFCICQHLLLTQ